MRVLIADDSEIVRRKLAELIGEIPSIEVVGEVSEVAFALNAADRLRPDIVIVDLHMPGNGLRLVEALGRFEPKPTILVLTNYPYLQYRKRSLQAGAEYFFDKSSDFPSVVRVLNELAQADGSEGTTARDLQKGDAGEDGRD
jgi:DNA-binding NarL/FixJ family response regulator